jgi:hypothetical protein
MYLTEPGTSKQIKAWGYDYSSQELRVTFANDTTYAYSNVPAAIVSLTFFQTASSLGNAFNEYIKTQPYPYCRVLSTARSEVLR